MGQTSIWSHIGEVPKALEGQHRSNDDVADDQDHEIGRQIIGAMKVEPLSALLAGGGGLEITGEHPARPAIRATPCKAAADGVTDVTRGRRSRGLIDEARHPCRMRRRAADRKSYRSALA